MTIRWPPMRLQRLQWGLFAIGAASLAWCGVVIAEARLFQARQRAAFEGIPRSARYAAARGNQAAGAVVAPGLIGQLEIPRLKLSAVVVEGDDEDTLKVAVGHLPDTPLPWEAGNSALAGHRDTFFRALKGIRLGDEMRLATPQRELRYLVERTLVVEPDDVSVLEPSPEPRLTLITCFPFSYIGDAPHRFIVQARQIGITSS
jgi:sortase A